MPGETDLPEAARRRLASRVAVSALTTAEHGACLELGMEPIGIAQGYCVMQWGFYLANSPYLRGNGLYQGGGGIYSETYACPHGYGHEEPYRSWGQNYEQSYVEQAWASGFSLAHDRMVAEAVALGAHGVIGVLDTIGHVADAGVREFHLQGTAVVVRDAPTPRTPFVTYLSGQRLVKLVEAGWMPAGVVASLASMRVWSYCVTQYQSEGNYGVDEMAQLTRAHAACFRLVSRAATAAASGDELHGLSLQTSEFEVGEGDFEIQYVLRASRVRRFKDFDPLPLATPVVRLLDAVESS